VVWGGSVVGGRGEEEGGGPASSSSLPCDVRGGRGGALKTPSFGMGGGGGGGGSSSHERGGGEILISKRGGRGELSLGGGKRDRAHLTSKISNKGQLTGVFNNVRDGKFRKGAALYRGGPLLREPFGRSLA